MRFGWLALEIKFWRGSVVVLVEVKDVRLRFL